MGLHGKLIAAIEFKAGGDVFHEIMRHNPEHFSKATPEKVHGCDLHEGQFGHAGSIICWTYTHGKYSCHTTYHIVIIYIALPSFKICHVLTQHRF